MTLVSEFRLMSLSVLYDLMYPVSVLTNVLSILDTFNTGVTPRAIANSEELEGTECLFFGERWKRTIVKLYNHYLHYSVLCLQ